MKLPPVVLVIFNRPQFTQRLWDVVSLVKPPELIIIADGPRQNCIEDEENCTKARNIASPTWPCATWRIFQDENIGCSRSLAQGLGAVFGQVDDAIILEDDCIPDRTFFGFCSELLEAYRDDERVGQICGSLKIAPQWDCQASYFFSKYGPVWGWASWARAWSYYDLEMHNWVRFKARHTLESAFTSKPELAWRNSTYDSLCRQQFTWDYQWQFSKTSQSMLSIMPAVNLVENIGGADHSAPAIPIRLPVCHPEWVYPDHRFDAEYSDVHWPQPVK